MGRKFTDFSTYDFYKIEDHFEELKDYPSTLVQGTRPKAWPKVAISIPTYKRVGALEEAIESSLHQKGDFQDYVVVVVDDNPDRNDETEKFMVKYKDNPKVLYFKNDRNCGVGRNWNKLYDLPQTEWVVMLHDDDMLSSHYLQYVSQCFKADVDAVYVDVEVFDNGHAIRTSSLVGGGNSLNVKKLTLSDNYVFAETMPCGVAMRRDVVRRLGGYDWEVCAPDAFFAKTIFYSNAYMIQGKLGFYRKGLNDTLNPGILEALCEQNHFSRRNKWLKMGIPRFLVNWQELFGDLLFKENMEESWNAKISCPFIPDYSRTRYEWSKFWFRVMWKINRLKSRYLSRSFKIEL